MKNEAEKISIGNGISVARIKSIEQARPYFQEILDLTNRLLPPAYPRISTEDLQKIRHTLTDGRVVDFKETWNGNTFLLFKDKRLVGVTVGRRECFFDGSGESKFTGRGFMPWVVADPEILSSPKTIFLILPLKSLVNAGAGEIQGSCSLFNTRIERMCSRLAVRRWTDGDWVRYIIDKDGVERVFAILQKNQKPDGNLMDKLVAYSP